ncbi:hypothetical protein [Pseudohongiella sp. O18]|uniref:hypothetical protein n=1 Tax=Pseudohongiella sp. O18 TaxID=2904248 RepID=UPI001F42A407|nr:hypothetical protein [Pseudohongiella sp. O18]
MAPALVFLIYIACAVWLMLTGHPHEDAYILNIYARNLADGHGISYFIGGPAAEGATDFLWMLLLALGEFIGVDAASFAHLLNGIGLIAITCVATRLLSQDSAHWHYHVSATLLIALIVTSQIAQSSLSGFSAGFYCGAIALLFWLLYIQDSRHLVWIPVISIVVALTRPDGAIIGVTATLIGFFIACRHKQIEPFLKVSAICLCIGAFYFAWRVIYFDQWLPLPLIVKSADAQSLPGLRGHIGWARHNFYIGVIALIAFVVMRQRWRLLLASLPIGALLFALLFATQSQNIADRFQAPATTVLILWCAIFLDSLIRRDFAPGLSRFPIAILMSTALVLLLLILATNQSFKATVSRAANLRAFQYINTFPYYLARHTPPNSRLALTEAGRFAYWLPGQKYDLIGLNTAEFAHELATPDAIAALRADLIFVHIAGNADFGPYCQQDFCELSAQQVRQSMTKEDPAWSEIRDSVVRSPLAAISYYLNHPEDFFAYAVQYSGGYHHFFLLSKSGLITKESFESALTFSFEDECNRSYWQLRYSHPPHIC